MSPPFWERSQGSNVFCWSLCALFFFFFSLGSGFMQISSRCSQEAA